MSAIKQRVIRRVVEKKPDKIQRTLDLKEFFEKRNKVLILRAVGGLGDILMHRMMFEDFKRLAPEIELTFACPKAYHEAVMDHPFIDHVVDSHTVDKQNYMAYYNTTTACGRYEIKIAPLADKHRSDIWANHCGLELENHNMHIRLSEKEKDEGKKLIESCRKRSGPTVAVCPISAMKVKDLLPHQLKGLIEGLIERGLAPFGLHTQPIAEFSSMNEPCIFGLNIRQWMSVLNQADYVVSVDTAAFHCAGGMGKPLTGIFTFADGFVYGKYFEFFLVQKHRNNDPEWTCGPCFNWGLCPKTKDTLKPCLTDLTSKNILDQVDRMLVNYPTYPHANNQNT